MIRLPVAWSRIPGIAVVLALASAFPVRAPAAGVADLYEASVPLADASPESTRAGFAEALRRVLVKVTGSAPAANDQGLVERLGDPEALVQQYRRDGAGALWARFDPVALRRALEAAGVPTWGEDRPLTLVWLAYDGGGGERDVLGSGGADAALASAVRRELLEAASARGLPLVLPLRDSQEMAAVSYADVWGEFTEPVEQASARYRADALLIGRARLYPPGMNDVRWTLLLGEERLEWRGGIAAGPEGVAERLAARLTSAPGAQRSSLRLAVSGIGSMDQYGLVLGHLDGLPLVESVALDTAVADTLVFDLALRGDPADLARALAALAVIEPDPGAGPGATRGAPADLRYRLAAQR